MSLSVANLPASAHKDRFVVSDVRCRGGARCLHEGAPPDSQCGYRVAWQINPHMRVGASSLCRAEAQHRSLVAALLELGAEVHTLPFVHGGFDSVFVKDNAVLVDDDGLARALMTRPCHRERAMEQEQRTATLVSEGFAVERGRGARFEGGDVVMLPGGQGALLGVGPRSAPEAAHDLEAFIGAPVTCVELCDPFLYHLDTALTVLSDGTALACRDAFTARGWTQLKMLDAISYAVAIPRAEALRFALNMIEVGDHVLLGAASPLVEGCLRALGRIPVVIDLSEFIFAGGSAACLVSRIHSRRITRATLAA